MTHHPRFYSGVIAAICLLLSFGFTWFYVSIVDERREHLERKQDQVWCDLLVALDERNRSIPNPGPDQVEFFNLVSAIRKGYGCN